MKKIKMNKFRSGGVILFLCNVSLFTMGFSSWMIVGKNVTASVNLNIGEIIELSDVFLIQEPKMFTYNEYGILQDETFVTDGYVYFPIIVDTTASNYELIQLDNGHLNLTVYLKSTSSINVFSENYFKSSTEVINPITYSISNTDFSYSCSLIPTYSKIDNIVYFPINITDSFLSNDKIYINVCTHFIFDDFSSVYSTISSNGLSFSISVGANFYD